MPTKPRTHRPPQDNRPSARQRGYTAQWERASAAFLAANPWCLRCAEEGRTVPAECVDHIRPHKGDMGLFWDQTNWQPLCTKHHNRKTAREDGGFGRAVKQ